MDSRTPIIRLSTLDFIIGVSGLIAWGASLIGLVTNLWLGSSILLAAFGLLTYEFWKWAKYKGWAVALRIAVVIIADAVVLFTGSRQVIYQYHQDLVQTGARSQSLNVTSTIASAQAYLANTLLWVRWGWVIPSIVIEIGRAHV